MVKHVQSIGIKKYALLYIAHKGVVGPAVPEACYHGIELACTGVARGVFGAPTSFVGDMMFFGNDRLPFVEMALKGELK